MARLTMDQSICLQKWLLAGPAFVPALHFAKLPIENVGKVLQSLEDEGLIQSAQRGDEPGYLLTLRGAGIRYTRFPLKDD